MFVKQFNSADSTLRRNSRWLLGVTYFIEMNCYGSGSKLKSTAGKYKDVSSFWAKHEHTDTQNSKYKIEFIWITDGVGWHSAKAPLREFFDRSPALLNLQSLQDGALERILK